MSIVGWVLATLVFLSADDRVDERPITAEDRAHWSFTPVCRPELPNVRDAAWVRNPIDRFILHRLEAEGLPPSPEADRATLLRRLSFDLIGLPPTPEEVACFLADDSPNAYEAQVDRLLASPHFGERWAQHWLDLARYADTDGFEFDEARPDAWRFRDWVVQALNEDMPFDRFLSLQLAGDEVAPERADAAIATGWCRCYPDMVDLNDQALRRQNALDDITETTGLVFLGLTIGCAKCHDHKTDPVRQADFYRLQAFFTPARFRDDFPLASRAEREAHEARMREWQASMAETQRRLLEIEAPARDKIAPGPPPGLDDRTTTALARSNAERTDEEVRLAFEALAKDKRIKADALVEAIAPEARLARAEALAELDRVRKAMPAPLPKARVVDEAGGTPSPTFLRKRGDFYTPGPEVSPTFPGVLQDGPPRFEQTSRSSGRRAALAAWLTRPGHPLTSRVIANRLWQHHLGRGIVPTPSDFGKTGEPPTHPALLDWLASELVSRGWSMKAIHRLIVTSATYRQSAAESPVAQRVDPDNALLWRYPRRRLDGEALRDAMLAASGQLCEAMRGPGVFPELPAELTKLSSKGAIWPVSPLVEDRDRRSLYVFIRRNLRYPFFEAFDRPDTNASCPKRPITTIAPQALSLLNGKLATEAARHLAARVAHEAGPSADARIERAYLLCLGRTPDATERALGAKFLGGADDPSAALADLALALLNLNEFVMLE
jgi:hypothetical protein